METSLVPYLEELHHPPEWLGFNVAGRKHHPCRLSKSLLRNYGCECRHKFLQPYNRLNMVLDKVSEQVHQELR